TIENTEHNYEIADSEEKISALINTLSASVEFCFDSETTSLTTLDAEIVGLSFAVRAQHAYYVPIPAERNEAQKIIDLFVPLFSDENKTLIGQNIKYDYQVLKNYGVTIKNKLF